MLKEEREELMNQKAVRDAKAENDRLKSELSGATTGATSGATKVKPIEVAEVKMVIAADLSNLVIQGRKVIAAEMKGESICITFDGGEVVEMAFSDAVAAVVVGFFSLNDVKQVSKAPQTCPSGNFHRYRDDERAVRGIGRRQKRPARQLRL